jgi:hypothetical protein
VDIIEIKSGNSIMRVYRKLCYTYGTEIYMAYERGGCSAFEKSRESYIQLYGEMDV